MNGHLVRLDGKADDDFDSAEIEEALHADQILWLDLHDSGEDNLALLRDVFNIHPVAVEDALEFGQRPKIEEYDGFTSMVFFGSNSVGQPMTEVHFFYAKNFLVTLHKDQCPAFEGMRTMLERRHGASESRLIILHHVLDSLIDSLFPMLSAFDDRIDTIQEQIFENPVPTHLSTLFALKRWLVDVRKVVTPQRDMMAAVVSSRVELPGMTPQYEPYMRDLYDHLIRIADLVDNYRDLLSNSVDAYMSMVSNRQNDVMKTLTVIATIFLPLTFLTGFFGQNFGFLVNHVGSSATFWGLGIGLDLATTLGLWALFRRRHWT